MKQTYMHCLAALVLLIFANVKADIDFKQKFGNEFIADLKHYHAEILQQNMKHLANIFEELLNDFEPSSTEAQQFKSNLAEIRELQNQIGDTITVDIVRKVKDVTERVLLELVLWNLKPSIALNPAKQRTIKKAFDNAAESEKEGITVFQQKTYKRYHEMFKQIPDDERNARPEYMEIDAMLERISKTTDSEAGNLMNAIEYLRVFNLLGTFFDVPEYKELFSM